MTMYRTKVKQTETITVNEAVELYRFIKDNNQDNLSLNGFFDALADTYRIVKEEGLLDPYDEHVNGYHGKTIQLHPEITAATPIIVKQETEGDRLYVKIAACKKPGCSAGRKYHCAKYGSKYLEKIIENDGSSVQEIDFEDFDMDNTVRVEYTHPTITSPDLIDQLTEIVNIFQGYENLKIKNVEQVHIRCVPADNKWTIGFPTIQKNKDKYNLTIGYSRGDFGNMELQWSGDSFEQALLNELGGIRDAGNGVGIVAIDGFPAYLKRKLGVIGENEVHKNNKKLSEERKSYQMKIRELEETNEELKMIKPKLTLIERLFKR